MEYTNKPSLFIVPKGSIKKPDILVFEIMNDKWNEAFPLPYISTVKTQGGVHVARKAFVEHVVMIEQGCLQVYVASKLHRTIHYGIKGEEVDEFSRVVVTVIAELTDSASTSMASPQRIRLMSIIENEIEVMVVARGSPCW